ncbi:MAG: hypothetical protein KJ718_00985 [Nanoarchaeota archaeon]|nr:hypothetical protein [Nanoarchaeota archaeon]MBU1051110.1 hypothetical protein [Nanoarchaeota archaeon]MBU1987966.1 hypothetical protein [Nanoarchaeota archaeon]
MELGEFLENVNANSGAAELLREYREQEDKRKNLKEEVANALHLDGDARKNVDPQNPVTLENLAKAGNEKRKLARIHYRENEGTWLTGASDKKLAEMAISVKSIRFDDSHYDSHKKARDVIEALNPNSPNYQENVERLARTYINKELKEPAEKAAEDVGMKLDALKESNAFYAGLTDEMMETYKAIAKDVARAGAVARLKQQGALDDPAKAVELYLKELTSEFEDTFPEQGRKAAVANYTRDNIRATAAQGDEGVDQAVMYMRKLG